MNETLLLAILALVGGTASAAMVTAYFQRPRTRAEARLAEVEADTTLSAGWKEWADKLEGRVNELENEVKGLRAEVEAERTANREAAWLLQLFVQWSMTMRERLVNAELEPPAPPPAVRVHLVNLGHIF